MERIALIGAKGYVGTALFNSLRKNSKIKLTPVTRSNYSFYQKRQFDIIINSSMPSARYFAKLYPQKDFEETVIKTANIVYNWKYKKIIQISSISARSELDTVYGRHKAAAENICKFGNNLIIRLTSMFGETLEKGALIDILDGKKVFVDKKSRYSFASLDFVSNWVSTHLKETGLVEVGAKNSLSLERITKILKLNIKFEGKEDIQVVKNPRSEFPDANEVLDFLKEKINTGNT